MISIPIPIYWLIAFVALVGIEIATMALTTVWLAGGAIVAFLFSLFDTSIEVQLAAFVIVSFLLLFLTRPLAAKYVNSQTIKTNAAQINNDLGTGSVVVAGQEWTARTKEPDDTYPVGTMVEIKEIQGVKLIVEKL